jgi:type I restriction enzyme M protein
LLKNLKIPLPPLEVQKEIVSEIEGYQKIIDGARQVVENWRPSFTVDPEWPLVELGDVCHVNPESNDPTSLFGNSEFVYIDISSVDNKSNNVDFSNVIKSSEAPSRARRIIKSGDVLLSTVRPNLKAFAYLDVLPEKVLASTGFAVLRCNESLNPKFLFISICGDYSVNQMINSMGKGAYPSINSSDVENIRIHVPPLEVQNGIVASIEEEQRLVESNKRLIEIYEAKIKSKINEVWGS